MTDDYRWKRPGAEFQRKVDEEKEALKVVDSGKVKHLLLSSIFVIAVAAVMFGPGMPRSVYDIPQLKCCIQYGCSAGDSKCTVGLSVCERV